MSSQKHNTRLHLRGAKWSFRQSWVYQPFRAAKVRKNPLLLTVIRHKNKPAFPVFTQIILVITRIILVFTQIIPIQTYFLPA